MKILTAEEVRALLKLEPHATWAKAICRFLRGEFYQIYLYIRWACFDAKCRLTSVGEFPTGGAGYPTPQPPDPATDPLASQGALLIGRGNQFLFAVNAGSNQISVLQIKKNSLDVVDFVDSGGIRPISLALHEDLLYVLNEGGTPNITGFEIEEDGTLTQLDGSTQPLIGGAAADLAQIGFSRDGELLFVREKNGNRLNTYMIDDEDCRAH